MPGSYLLDSSGPSESESFEQTCYDDLCLDVETHSAFEILEMLAVTWVVHNSVSVRAEEEASESLRRDEEAFVH